MFKYITLPFPVLAVALAHLSPSGFAYQSSLSHVFIWSLLWDKHRERGVVATQLPSGAHTSDEPTAPNAHKTKYTWPCVPQRCFISHLLGSILKKDTLPYLANNNIIQRIQMGFFPRKLSANHITVQMLINKAASDKSCKGIFLRHRLK